MGAVSLVATHPDLGPTAPTQRSRLLEAMTQAVAERGYAEATVADAVRIARVSRGTFYALFASKEDCFVQAYRAGIDVVVARIEAAVAAEAGDWRAKLRAALRAYLTTLADEPRFARSHLLEIQAAGATAQRERDATIARFAERYRASFAAGGTPPSDAALFVLSAGIDQLVCAHVRARDARSLADLEDTVVDCALSLGAREGG